MASSVDSQPSELHKGSKIKRLSLSQSYITSIAKDATLGTAGLKHAVQLPPGTEQSEWIAVKVLDIFNEVNLLWGALSDLCTAESCPVMSAGDGVEYLWSDDDVHSPTRLPAPQYMHFLLTWVDSRLSDTSIFPIQPGVPFPPEFYSEVRRILRRLFRVYAHTYHKHFYHLQQAQAEAHLNCCFKHFMFFTREFQLMSPSDLEPLKPLIDELLKSSPSPEGEQPRPAPS